MNAPESNRPEKGVLDSGPAEQERYGWYGSIIEWFAHNSVAANLLMAILIVGGVYSYMSIKKEMMPKVEPNLITINVPYLGAAPEEVEEGVLIKVEEAIEDIEGIKDITSRAREGSGSINVEVDVDYNLDNVMDEVKLRVDAISTFPAETEEPIISRARWQQQVIWITVFSNDLGERALKELARQIKDEIVATTNITRVEIVGGRDYEIAIEVSESTLREYNLTLDEVANAGRRGSLNLSGGSIRSEGGDILVRTEGQAYTGEQFENIVIRTNPDGTRLLVRDIADVQDAFEDRDRYAIFNGQRAVSLRIYSVGNQSELELAEQARNYIDGKKARLPEGVGIDYWGDISYYLNDRLEMMQKNLLGGAVLVFLVLALFLRLKLAFWVMVGLVVAFLGAMWAMQIPDVTINMLSLFGFILVLGIVVDDAIVIGESAYTQIRRHGHSEVNVVRGTMRVAIPATFGVLTTIAAFAPFFIVSGPTGSFFQAIGWVVVICLIFSIVESKLILPAHLAHMKVRTYQDEERPNPLIRFQRFFSEGLHKFVDRFYVPTLNRTIRHPVLTLALFISLLLMAFALPLTPATRVVFIPDLGGDFMQVQLEMAEGTPARRTHEVMDQIQDDLWAVDRRLSEEHGMEPGSVVDKVLGWAWRDTGGFIFVEQVKSDTSPVSTNEVVRAWRDEVGRIPGAKQLTIGDAGGWGGGPSISFQLLGSNLDQVKAAAAELEAKVASYNGVYDIRNSEEGGSRQIKLDIEPQAESLGLTLSDLARQVRQGFYGQEIQRIQRGEDDVRVMVRYPKDQRDSVGHLEDMRIRTPQGDAIPFGSVAEISLTEAPSVIRRFNRERSVSVSAAVDKEIAEPGKITGEIQQEFLPQLLASYPGVRYRASGATREQAELMRELTLGLGLSLFLIYSLLAIPLRSYIQPLLIMSVIPFGFIGAIAGHALLGLDVSLLSIFGIIALSGVVVNDSLILVDFVNRARANGMALADAVITATKARFRAILLTSATTFLGLVPIVFLETSLQAQGIKPMAAALAFGIVFATVITLFLIPALYIIADGMKRRVRRLFSGSTPDSSNQSEGAVERG